MPARSNTWRVKFVVAAAAAAIAIVGPPEALRAPQAGTMTAEAAKSAAPSARLARHLGDGSVPNGLGINIHVSGDAPTQFERIRAAGFRLVRTDLLWAETEQERGVYDWRAADRLAADLQHAGLTPLFILAYSNPLYARRLPGRPDSPSLAYAAPQQGPARAAFMRFARTAAARYGAAAIWEVWNEPDHNFGQPPDLRDYVGFATEVCGQIRAVAPDAAVIGPAASGFRWSLLRDFIAADRSGCFDALSVHPYRDEPPESVLKDWAAAASRAAQCGRGACPTVVSGEWGYSSVAGVLSEEQQAEFVARAYLLNLSAGIPLSIVYDWQDDGPDRAEKEANFGLIDFAGRAKAAHRLLTGLTRDLSGLQYLGRIDTGDARQFLLAFGRDGATRKLVGWSASGRSSTATLPGNPLLTPQPTVISPFESRARYGENLRR